MTKGRLLLVEDDESLGFVTADQLSDAGYEVSWAKSGDEGISCFKEGNYDLCLLDVMLPNLDGFHLASHIRTIDDTVPILFVTARSLEEDRLKGFEIGGDDYITKPYSMNELIYRVQVFLRRSSVGMISPSKEQIEFGKFSFDPGNLVLSSDSATITLTQMEADLLSMLLDHRNVLVKREDILIQVWGENDYFKGRSLDVFISRLRKYLKPDPNIEIRNHHGVGFSLNY